QELHVKSVNGRIRLDVPRDFDAEVSAHTANGRVVGQGVHGPNGGVPRNGHWLFGDPRARIVLETETGVIEVRRRCPPTRRRTASGDGRGAEPAGSSTRDPIAERRRRGPISPRRGSAR